MERFLNKFLENSKIENELYQKYNVKKGLRDLDGTGVVAGLTSISTVTSKKEVNGELVPCEGVLHYRGINVKDLVEGFQVSGTFGFEETCYLLLFGELPNKAELADFTKLLSDRRTLPKNFVRDIIMKAPSKDLMNQVSKAVLNLASYDDNVEDTSLAKVLDQSLSLISIFPLLACYSYQAYAHYQLGESLHIHLPEPSYSTAENILRLMRPDKEFSRIEAEVLDLALVLHMEHGGGNNSTFTTHVVTSSGCDTYATIVAALQSLKGPKHGGANIKVTDMMANIKANVNDPRDEKEVEAYLAKILHKEAFDNKGLIYGMGHAVYSLSDPRAELFKACVEDLAKAKGLEEEFAFYSLVENLAPKVIAKERNIYKGVAANVDFYSGFVYHMLDLPLEMYTPLFAIARIVGWSAHRMEELLNMNKIIRPAYQSVSKEQVYVPIHQRE